MKENIKKFWHKLTKSQTTDYGIGLPPGAKQYRAYVGPPQDFDLVAAMTFNLITTLGLRQHHKLLDIGCGSLRTGRLLIPYLNTGNYVGVEPNKWLVEEGIQRETGQDQILLKKCRFYYDSSLKGIPNGELFDFVIAQSIFSHCGPDLLENWLDEISNQLSFSGLLVATFIIGEDCQTNGWFYPGCVSYTRETMNDFAKKAGLNFFILDWKHPRQTWGLFTKKDISNAWFLQKPLTWNTYLDEVAAENSIRI